jgi:hypothetical protein
MTTEIEIAEVEMPTAQTDETVELDESQLALIGGGSVIILTD